jgi:hypothetical protein
MGFADVASRDPTCAMAHWGRAMTHYHQLWDVPVGAGLAAGITEIDQAKAIANGTPRERALIAALGAYYENASGVPAATRAMRYSDAMAEVARDYPATTRSRSSSHYRWWPPRHRPIARTRDRNGPQTFSSRSGSASRIIPACRTI